MIGGRPLNGSRPRRPKSPHYRDKGHADKHATDLRDRVGHAWMTSWNQSLARLKQDRRSSKCNKDALQSSRHDRSPAKAQSQKAEEPFDLRMAKLGP